MASKKEREVVQNKLMLKFLLKEGYVVNSKYHTIYEDEKFI